ncbi:MAG: lysozyme inhibitor LprI family protein [Verrucomicrobiota bacterium]
MKELIVSLGVLLASAIVVSAGELKSKAGWIIQEESTGPFRQSIVATSPDGGARYEAEFTLVNEGAEFSATLAQGRKNLGNFICSYVVTGTDAHFNVYEPPSKELDASGRFALQGDEYEEMSLAEAKAFYEKHDKALNNAYKELMARLTDAQKTDLRDRQRSWIEYKEYISGFQAQAEEGKERDSAAYWETAGYITQTRTGFLKHVYENEKLSDHVGGTYVDERGGILTIVERDNDWIFTIQVVRGPTYHLGFIRGTANRNPKGAEFEDLNQDNFYDGKGAKISLKWMGSRIAVEGENTQYYHGARAYFDGEYFKASDLAHTFPDLDY